MGSNLDRFNAILERDSNVLDLIQLREIAKNFTTEEVNSFRSNRDELQAYLDDINPEALSGDEIDAVIDLARMWTHLVCTLFYSATSDFFQKSHLEKMVELPDCEEDNGRSDSCFGAHFFVTLQEQVSENVLEALLKREHSDLGFFPWLIARNSKSSQSLLETVASNFTDEFSWRVGGYYTNDDYLIEEDDYLERFVLFQIYKNPNCSENIMKLYAEKFDFLKSLEKSNQRFDLEAEEIQEKLKII